MGQLLRPGRLRRPWGRAWILSTARDRISECAVHARDMCLFF